MVEAARTSETLVNFYQTTRRYNPEDSHLHFVILIGAFSVPDLTGNDVMCVVGQFSVLFET
jgi:hypothetical protein